MKKQRGSQNICKELLTAYVPGKGKLALLLTNIRKAKDSAFEIGRIVDESKEDICYTKQYKKEISLFAEVKREMDEITITPRKKKIFLNRHSFETAIQVINNTLLQIAELQRPIYLPLCTTQMLQKRNKATLDTRNLLIKYLVKLRTLVRAIPT